VVTAPGDSAMRQLALRAVAQRAGAGAETPAVADAAQHAYDELVRVSTPLIGTVAVDALTGRALYLVQQHYPWLAAREPREWSGPFAQVVFCLGQQAPPVATEAAGAILGTITELLATFVGQALTARLLQEAWPQAFADAEPRRHKA
jgi:hypothetical protein